MKIRSARAAVRAALAGWSVRRQMELRFLGGRGLRVTPQAGGRSGSPLRRESRPPRNRARWGAGRDHRVQGRPRDQELCRRPPLPAPAPPELNLGAWVNGSLARVHDRQEAV